MPPSLAAVALATTVQLEAKVAEYLLKHRLPHVFDHLVQEVAVLRPKDARKGLVDALCNLDYNLAFPHRLDRPDCRPFHTMDVYTYDNLVNNPDNRLKDREVYFDLFQIRGLVFHLLHALAEERPADWVKFCKEKLLDPKFAPEIVTPDLEAEAREKAEVEAAEKAAQDAAEAAAAEAKRLDAATEERLAVFTLPKPAFGELRIPQAYVEPDVVEGDEDGYAAGEEVGLDTEEGALEWEEERIDGMVRPPRPLLDASAAAIISSLPFTTPKSSLLEFVWLSAGDPASSMRSKTVTFDEMPKDDDGAPALVDAEDNTIRIPMIEFKAAASSMESNHLTGSNDDDVFARPQLLMRDPFRVGASTYIVFCDTVLPPPSAGLFVQKHQLLNGDLVDYVPHETNKRWACAAVLGSVEGESFDASFTISQAYGLVDADTGSPLGWSGAVPHAADGGAPGAATPYFAGTGAGAVVGRELADAHLAACMSSGVRVSDLAAGKLPGTWTFTVGPCTAVELGDHVLMARYILQRVCESFGVKHTLGPEVAPGYSPRAVLTMETSEMRSELGYKTILSYLESLRKKSDGRKLTWTTTNANDATLTSEIAVLQPAFPWIDWWEKNEGIALAVDPPSHPWLAEYGKIVDYRASVADDPYVAVTRLISEATGAPGKPAGEGYLRDAPGVPPKSMSLSYQN